MRLGKRALALVAAIVVCAATPADARNADAVLHERIPPDPREDVALSISLDGDLPAAIDTPSGVVPAPDPQRAPDKPAPYSPAERPPDKPKDIDRDTRKPDSLAYDEPFVPSTAPFKRLSAYDQVDSGYTMSVARADLRPFPTGKPATALQSEDLFYADMIVDVRPDRPSRIPSVGPGARILRARAGVGTSDVGIVFVSDGAENLFVQSTARATRARLVMEIAVQRQALGGDFGDPSWGELASRPVAAVPPNVARSAADVAKRIGIVAGMRPRDVVAKMVAYFRAFQDSDDPPAATRDKYLDLALSQKGVCRHRAFSFLVTALALSIPTRYIENEAHAWVEVFDGRMFRRIDLGGAGRMNRDLASNNTTYDNPADSFSWPPGASRGQDVNPPRLGVPPPQRGPNDRGQPSTASSSGNGGANGGPNGANGRGNGNGGPNGSPQSRRGADNMSREPGPADTRPPTDVALEVLDADARRGGAFHVRGALTADGDACPHTPVTITLLSNNTAFPIGSIATDEHGRYDASITLNMSLAVGDYDVRAFTLGNTRCGEGTSK